MSTRVASESAAGSSPRRRISSRTSVSRIATPSSMPLPPGRATQTTDAVPRGPVRAARLWTRPHASPRMLTHCTGGRPDLTQVSSSNERSCLYCPVTKGAQTREAVLPEARDQASLRGLNGLTIGTLADRIGMSKSGLFAHFRSKDQLQVDTLDHAAERFRTHVVLPALREPAGEPRLRTLVERWLGWDGDADYAAPGGCVFAAGAMEFDD